MPLLLRRLRENRDSSNRGQHPAAAIYGRRLPSCAARLSSWGCGSALCVLLWNCDFLAGAAEVYFACYFRTEKLRLSLRTAEFYLAYYFNPVKDSRWRPQKLLFPAKIAFPGARRQLPCISCCAFALLAKSVFVSMTLLRPAPPP